MKDILSFSVMNAEPLNIDSFEVIRRMTSMNLASMFARAEYVRILLFFLRLLAFFSTSNPFPYPARSLAMESAMMLMSLKLLLSS